MAALERRGGIASLVLFYLIFQAIKIVLEAVFSTRIGIAFIPANVKQAYLRKFPRQSHLHPPEGCGQHEMPS